jgi:hypothetical protein
MSRRLGRGKGEVMSKCQMGLDMGDGRFGHWGHFAIGERSGGDQALRSYTDWVRRTRPEEVRRRAETVRRAERTVRDRHPGKMAFHDESLLGDLKTLRELPFCGYCGGDKSSGKQGRRGLCDLHFWFSPPRGWPGTWAEVMELELEGGVVGRPRVPGWYMGQMAQTSGRVAEYEWIEDVVWLLGAARADGEPVDMRALAARAREMRRTIDELTRAAGRRR